MSAIYFDNAATTQPSEAVLRKAQEVSAGVFGNPSSPHGYGVAAEREIWAASKSLSQALGVAAQEIYYTSGGTEANNLAILGAADAYKRNGTHIITCGTEHPSVLEPARRLQALGFEVTVLPVNPLGHISAALFQDTLRNDTILVSLMQVNNETGAMHDIPMFSEIVKRRCFGRSFETLFHVDGVQGFGKYKLPLKNIDLYTISAHKIHGLKGVGALYARRGVRLTPLMYGGGQQSGIRPGTENVAGIAAFGAAALAAVCGCEDSLKRAAVVRDTLIRELRKLPDVFINSAGGWERGESDYILNAVFKGVKGQVLVNALDAEGIFVSTGAACHSKRGDDNHVLKHMGLSPELRQSALRFSFSPENTVDEALRCARILAGLLPVLRRADTVRPCKAGI
ncbi:MAG: cysteine desulfurase [Clostridiales bacterium]|jgi:cysteine desulfurase|nr:cysteine desulfurase [Clostridiales bacterium]